MVGLDEGWIVISHRGDGHYSAKDAHGAKLYRFEKRAQAVADHDNAELPFLNLVVRRYFSTQGVTITGNQIRLA